VTSVTVDGPDSDGRHLVRARYAWWQLTAHALRSAVGDYVCVIAPDESGGLRFVSHHIDRRSWAASVPGQEA
jgi:hypothetical protein